jgi:hypothetical protein
MKLNNEFNNTGELGLEDVYNYSDWFYSLECMDMIKAYNSQNNTELKKAV